ncbi:hypothetical protein BAUCODRAFT_61487 [Baudoinia panamericana UAMH 10762]|uniref:HIT domain-containing protein n=1 Tax=Baudoinia panamericana (strain UAMH 10762) TaxID=717646 RepID=M2M1W1_BAUPA|nr:uncharacterized protein BAUCODRAFT_61487 [Baudoinia panamericana UAMH 10762]EMD01043.1 hypothetical protein BAUCODRAFT_61487 [Baudoinia panamericana UAMH 10762]
MSTVAEHYPIDCPFCNIANAYLPDPASPIPSSPDPAKVDPQCHLILSTPYVLGFLDILPIAPGHILLTTRRHYRTLIDLHKATSTTAQDWASRRAAEESLETSRALGEWLPRVSQALCKVTGIEDWNVVQNNGERAAQVVPHIHFHLIPRYQEGRRENAGKGKVDVGMLKSWRMFGRGAREELDDEEGAEIAAELREALQEVIQGTESVGPKL